MTHHEPSENTLQGQRARVAALHHCVGVAVTVHAGAVGDLAVVAAQFLELQHVSQRWLHGREQHVRLVSVARAPEADAGRQDAERACQHAD